MKSIVDIYPTLCEIRDGVHGDIHANVWVHAGGRVWVHEGGHATVLAGGYAYVYAGGHAEGDGEIEWEEEPNESK